MKAENMSPDQRRHEVAELLGRAMRRLVECAAPQESIPKAASSKESLK